MTRAIVTDVLLVEAAAFFERGMVTPSTLFAADSLVQAVMLHDEVVLGIAGATGMRMQGIEFIRDKLNFDFALKPSIPDFLSWGLPSGPDLDTFVHWISPEHMTANTSADVEIGHFSAVNDFLLARPFADITGMESLLENFGVDRDYQGGRIVEPSLYSKFAGDVRAKGGQPLSPNDLAVVRDMAWLAAAGYTLARSAKVEVYHSLLERPFFADQIKKPQGPLALMRKAEEAIEEEASFGTFSVPAYFGMILSKPQFDRHTFWPLLLEARERHAGFRKSVAAFESAISNAKSKGEIRILLKEQAEAWEAVLAREAYLRKDRLLYVIWEGVKTLGKGIGDKLVDLQKFERAIDKVGGMVPLWEDMLTIVPDAKAQELLREHFGSAPDQLHWQRVLAAVKTSNNAGALGEQ